MLGMLGGVLGPLISGGMGLLGASMQKPVDLGDQFKDQFKAKMKMGEKYGISKLVMAGAPASYMPSDNSVGAAVADMGQDISRAVQNGGSAMERMIAAETLKKARSENELIQAQTRSINVRTAQQAVPARPGGMDQFGNLIQPPVAIPYTNIFGDKVTAPAGATSAQTIADQYGDFAQEIYGMGRLAQDAYRFYQPQLESMGSSAWDYVKPWLGSNDVGIGYVPIRQGSQYYTGGSF